MADAALQANISLRAAAAETWDAVIIGAGPAGSVAALVLGRLGRRVLLVDRANFPRDKACGCCLGPAAIDSLRELELADVLDTHHAAPMTRFDLRAAQRELSVPICGGRVLSRRLLDVTLVLKAIGSGAMFLPHCTASIGSADDMYRHVQLRCDGESCDARAKLIIAAGGLGFAIDGPRSTGRSRERLWCRSRVGGATTIASMGSDLPRGAVRMIVARRGYVGLARLEDDQLAVGGAFDASLVRLRGGLGGAAAQVLEESNIELPNGFLEAHWLGAPHLTRRPDRVAAERVLVVGDAAGFVEPFTGEGMTWAIQSAHRAAVLAETFLQAENAAWDSAIESQWIHAHRALVRWRQWRCRMIAEALRHPMLVACCVVAGRNLPRLSQLVVDRIHDPQPTRAEVAGGVA